MESVRQPPARPAAYPARAAGHRSAPRNAPRNVRRHASTRAEAQLTHDDETFYRHYFRHTWSARTRTRPVVVSRLGAALLRWIARERFSQKEAAEVLGVGKKVLWGYLTCGLRPTSQTLERIHHVTGLDRGELLRLAALGSVTLSAAAVEDFHRPLSSRTSAPPPSPPEPLDAWDALTARVRGLRLDGAERRMVLAQIEALRAGALTPAQRVVTEAGFDPAHSVSRNETRQTVEEPVI